MRRFCVGELLLVMGMAACSPSPSAPLRPHALFSDHMVLQRSASVPIWGWAEAGKRITVHPDWQDAIVVEADASGRWSAMMDTPDAGGPWSLTISSIDTSVTIRDILFGEVWLASGQSNMEMPLSGWLPDNPIARSAEEIAGADFPGIRMFLADRAYADAPRTDITGRWIVAAPDSAARFPATAYFFAKDLHADLGLPVGVIHSSWGGTPAEAWVPQADLEGFGFAEADEAHTAPSVLYNGMIAPVIPYAIRGVVWYQGESNVGRGRQYETLFPALIRSWRERWKLGDFPFFYVQIAPYRYGEAEPSPAAELREAQRLTLALPNTGMVVTSDIGDPDNIHPANKHDVGGRLARWALARTYRRDIAHSGPLVTQAEPAGSAVIVHFDHVGGGLVARGGPLTHFELAGADGIFHPADAVIEGRTVVVRSSMVPRPAAVRFAWRDAAQPNLFNTEGLPASGFHIRLPS